MEVLDQVENSRFNEIQKIRKLYGDNFKTKSGKEWNGNITTKDFKSFNMKLLKSYETNTVAFDNDKIYNRNTDRLINRKTFFTEKNVLRSKYKKNDNLVSRNDTILDIDIYLNPIKNAVATAEQKNEQLDIFIDFSMINRNLSKFLNILNPTTHKYLLTMNDKIYTLSSSFISEIQQAIKEGVEIVIGANGVGSDIELITALVENDSWLLTVLPKTEKNKLIEGGFFNYLHKLEKVNLNKYGVFHDITASNYADNCLIDALQTAGYDTTAIKCLCRNNEIPMRHLKTIAEKLNIYITVRRLDDEKKKTHYGNKSQPEIQIGLINKHYFLIEPTTYTRYSIENYFDICNEPDFNKICKLDLRRNKYHRSNERFIDSYNVIKILLNNKETHLEMIKYNEEIYKTNHYGEVKEFGSLEYNDNIFEYGADKEEGNLMKNKPMGERDEDILDTIFFDFETTTGRTDGVDTIHKPYCLYTDRNEKGYFGENCGQKFLNDLVKKYGVTDDEEIIEERETDDGKTYQVKIKKIEKVYTAKMFVRLIAHNSGYDFRFIIKYLYGLDTIEKGTGLMNAVAMYSNNDANGVKHTIGLNIRDSLKMINMPLRNFGKCFGLSVEKEIMPYDLYTEERVETNHIDLDTCLSFVKEADKEHYLENLKKWDCIQNDKVNILKYAGEYCYLDCITLRDGYLKFKSLVMEGIGLDIERYMTLPSMANDYLVIQGCYEGVLKISGVPRNFIQRCVVGGRTMCRENKKSLVKNQPLADFDAVSLYPSAMARMKGFPLGKPKIIENFESIRDKADAFYVFIEITKIKKCYKFPCSSLLTTEGIRNFTNDLVGQKIYIDNIALEDLVKYQGAEYNFINGYYYDEGVNNKINETITHLFNQRLKFKKQKNPLQLVFKELMNSSYGKSCLKPIDSDSVYIPKDAFKEYVIKNYNYIKEATLLANGKFYKIKLTKPIDTHFNNVHVGVLILSMSKSIMFEVMTLAEDLDIDMYYTDTDSIHIDNSKINYLGEEFTKKYGRELIGSNMGQFHTDFDLEGSVGDIVASWSVFLGKKCYLDKLTGFDENGNELNDYHIRMKGVSSNCIKFKADNEYGGDLCKMFEELYNGEKITFDLLAVSPSFELMKNMTIRSRKTFNRSIKFN
tara:strand:- start:235 stop:3645 length:3411 start_codon:yes stop_codon:yes gene_type:complete